MQTIVSGKSVPVTDAIRAYAEEKADKLARHHHGVSKVEVLLDKHDNHAFEVEIVAHVDGSEHHVSKAHHDDLYHCIVEAVQKMDRQMVSLKEKRCKH